MRVLLKRAALVLSCMLAVLYAGDWLVYRYRVAHGTALDSVQVNQYLSIRLKGEKEEYDYIGPQQVECVRALFPRAGDEPCWWLRRHPEQWTRA